MVTENGKEDNSSIQDGNRLVLDLVSSMQHTFDQKTADKIPLFFTLQDNLYDSFVLNLSAQLQQEYQCTACRSFVNRYGGLVTISENGSLHSVMWDEATVPAVFAKSVSILRSQVENSQIKRFFQSEKQILGNPETGIWRHMSIKIPKNRLFQKKLLSAWQVAAEKSEDYHILMAGLQEYPLEVVEQAVTLLRSDSLYRSERCLGIAEWLRELHIQIKNAQHSKWKENIVWRAAATCPPGFCHIRSSMIGTLLDDIKAGLPYESVSRKFAEKMHPLQYQRPQASPSAGNIERAEQIFKTLGLEKSLERRYATVDELETIWKPTIDNMERPTEKEGIFSHLIPKKEKLSSHMDIPPITITFRKFLKTVLPIATQVEYYVEDKKANYGAILTAVHSDAPPILQWDSLDQRNPFSQYVYVNGSDYKSWNLKLGYLPVTAICYTPSMWYKEYRHLSKAVFFILDGAKDTDYKNAGTCIFPENLIHELREVRSTIEAYTKKAHLEGYEQSSACGIKLEASSTWNARFRVTTKTGIVNYILDRWD